MISSFSSTEIKANTLVSSFVYFVGGDHIADRTDVPIISQGRTSKGILIGEGCWIGTHVVISDDSTVGKDPIIGAMGIVNGSIPEFSIAGGIPAKDLRDRRNQAS